MQSQSIFYYKTLKLPVNKTYKGSLAIHASSMAQSDLNVNRMEAKEKHEFREVEVAANSHKQKQDVGRYCNNVAGVSN